MASEWFYNVDGEKNGPHSSAQLQALAKSGKLKPTDKVWKEGMAQWVAASTIKGLFPSSMEAVTAKKPSVAASTAADEQRKPPKRVGKGRTVFAIVAVAAVACVACLGGVIVVGGALLLHSDTPDKKLAENKEKPQPVQGAEENKGKPPPVQGAEKKKATSGERQRKVAEEKKIREEITKQGKGDIGLIIRDRLNNAKAKSGDVQVSLYWQSKDDLDLHVIAPSGEEIFFANRISRCGGVLDVDMNAAYEIAVIGAVENIYWPTGKAPLGKYRVYVHHFSHHGGLPGTINPVAFTVRVVHQGEARLFFGRVNISNFGRKVLVCEFEETDQQPDLTALLKMLDNPKERLGAIETLGGMGSKAKAAIPKLIPLLKQDEDASRAAAEALEQIGAPAKVDYDTIVDFLKDENVKVRIYAARRLSKLVEVTPRTVTALTAALKDNDAEVRLHVVSALAWSATAQIYRDKAVPPLLNALADNEVEVRQHVKNSLNGLGLNSTKDFQAIKGAVNHDNSDVRLYAMEILVKGKVNSDVAAVLVRSLKDSDTKVRRKAIEGLGNADREAKQVAFPALFESLNDQDKLIQAGGLASLEKLGMPPPSELPRLVKFLKHANADVRFFSVQTLSQLGGLKEKEDVAAVAATLKDDDKRIARIAAQILGNVGVEAKAVASDLQRIALKESDKELRRQAIVAIGKIGRVKDSVETLVAILDNDDLRQSAVESLVKCGPFDKSDTPAFASILKSNHPDVRLFAVNQLSKLGTDAVMPLSEALTDKETKIRLGAAVALGEIKGKEAISALTGAIEKGGEAKVRQELVVSLGKCGPFDKSDMPTLVSILKSNHTDVRLFAVNRLSKLGADAVTPLSQTLNDKEASVRSNVAVALGEIKGKDTAKALTGALEKESEAEVRLELVVALGKCGADAKEAVDLLGTFLLDKNRELRQATGITLGAIGPESIKAIPKLILAARQMPPPLPTPFPPIKPLPVKNITLQKQLDEAFRKAEDAYKKTLGESIKSQEDARKELDIYVSAFSKIGKGAVPPLTQLLKDRDKNVYVCLVAIKALGEIGPAAKEAIPSLTFYSGKNSPFPILRPIAQKAIERIQVK